MYVQVILWFVQKKFIKTKFDQSFHVRITFKTKLANSVLDRENILQYIFTLFIQRVRQDVVQSGKFYQPLISKTKILSSLKEFKIYVEENFFSWLFSKKMGLIIKKRIHDKSKFHRTKCIMYGENAWQRASIMENFEIFRIDGFLVIPIAKKGYFLGKTVQSHRLVKQIVRFDARRWVKLAINLIHAVRVCINNTCGWLDFREYSPTLETCSSMKRKLGEQLASGKTRSYANPGFFCLALMTGS